MMAVPVAALFCLELTDRAQGRWSHCARFISFLTLAALLVLAAVAPAAWADSPEANAVVYALTEGGELEHDDTASGKALHSVQGFSVAADSVRLKRNEQSLAASVRWFGANRFARDGLPS